MPRDRGTADPRSRHMREPRAPAGPRPRQLRMERCGAGTIRCRLDELVDAERAAPNGLRRRSGPNELAIVPSRLTQPAAGSRSLRDGPSDEAAGRPRPDAHAGRWFRRGHAPSTWVPAASASAGMGDFDQRRRDARRHRQRMDLAEHGRRRASARASEGRWRQRGVSSRLRAEDGSVTRSTRLTRRRARRAFAGTQCGACLRQIVGWSVRRRAAVAGRGGCLDQVVSALGAWPSDPEDQAGSFPADGPCP